MDVCDDTSAVGLSKGTTLPENIVDLIRQQATGIFEASKHPVELSELDVLSKMEAYPVPWRYTVNKKEAKNVLHVQRKQDLASRFVYQQVSRAVVDGVVFYCAPDLMPFRHEYRDEARNVVPTLVEKKSIVKIPAGDGHGKDLLFVSYAGLFTLLMVPPKKTKKSQGRSAQEKYPVFCASIGSTLARQLHYLVEKDIQTKKAADQIGDIGERIKQLELEKEELQSKTDSLELEKQKLSGDLHTSEDKVADYLLQLADERAKVQEMDTAFQAEMARIRAVYDGAAAQLQQVTKKRKILEQGLEDAPTFIASPLAFEPGTTREQFKLDDDARYTLSLLNDHALRDTGLELRRYLLAHYHGQVMDDEIRADIACLIRKLTGETPEDFQSKGGDDQMAKVYTFRNEISLMAPLRNSLKRVNGGLGSSVAMKAKDLLNYLVAFNRFVRDQQEAGCYIRQVFAEGALRAKLQALLGPGADVAAALDQAYQEGGLAYQPKRKYHDIREMFRKLSMQQA